MALTPIDAAKTIFHEALTSLMAHTIRGVTNHFEKEKIELTVLVIADTRGRINLMAPKEGATSLLMTNFVKGMDEATPNRLLAKIYIHKNANKHLARICIAHEIYHLLLELDRYKADGDWPSMVASTKEIEDECNQFAWQLCKYHDGFNRTDGHRKKHIFFPEGTFAQPFKTDSTKWYLEWPSEIGLDENKPFYKTDSIPLD